jgi:2-amino-4-hydroxy-6-hydroxymethyldihydropteridine diphosphokinase
MFITSPTVKTISKTSGGVKVIITDAGHPVVAYVGVGSNVGFEGLQPRELVERAIAELGRVVARSSLYATEPVGLAAQPTFLNAVVAVETELSPLELLEGMLAIERRLGRDRTSGVKNGPRTLDLDLLLYGELVMVSQRLTLPHPRLAERRFVLAPLAEIAPEMVVPGLGRTMVALLEALPGTGENGVGAVRRVASPPLITIEP